MIKNIIIAVLATALVVGGVFAINGEVAEAPKGAVASPDLMSPYFSFGGVRQWASKTTALNSASSTICSLQSPAGTSSLVYASVRLDTSTTSASILTLGRAANTNATTSLIGASAVGASTQIDVVASSTATQAYLFPGNTYLNVGMQAVGSGGTVSPTGSCQAIWVQI